MPAMDRIEETIKLENGRERREMTATCSGIASRDSESEPVFFFFSRCPIKGGRLAVLARTSSPSFEYLTGCSVYRLELFVASLELPWAPL